MKLATFRNGTRDGSLMLVSRDLTHAVRAESVVAGLRTLQQLLDDWPTTELKLERIYAELNEAVDGRRPPPFEIVGFDPACCTAPLPRAFQWADGSAYVNHVELVRRARGAEMPASFWTEPLMYQGGSDAFLGPCDAIELADEAWGIDLEGEIAVITDDVAMGTTTEEAGEHICLLMLVNDVSLRNLIPTELAKGFGFFHGKPSTAFSPVAVTPDELGSAWRDCKVHLPLLASINGRPLGKPNAGIDMTFSFADAHRPRRPHPQARRRHHHRLGHGVQQRHGRARQTGGAGRRRLHLSCRAAHGGDDPRRQAEDALPEVRRPRAHRDAGRDRPLDLRRHRPAGRAV